MKRAIFSIATVIFLSGTAWARQAQLHSFEEKDLYGFKNTAGDTVIAPRYQHVEEFNSCGIAGVWNPEPEGWSFIDSKGQKLKNRTPYIFDNGLDYYVEGLTRFRNGKKVGFIDPCGHIKIPAQFDGAFPFDKGRAAVCLGCHDEREGEHIMTVGGRWGMIDRKGKIIEPFHKVKLESK